MHSDIIGKFKNHPTTQEIIGKFKNYPTTKEMLDRLNIVYSVTSSTKLFAMMLKFKTVMP